MKTIIKLNSCNSSLHMSSKNYILTKEVAQKKLQRMAYEILERNAEEDQIILAGIKENGLVIVKKMETLLRPIYKGQLDLMEININKKNLSEITISPEIDLN